MTENNCKHFIMEICHLQHVKFLNNKVVHYTKDGYSDFGGRRGGEEDGDLDATESLK